jgi:hypothetical protein
LAGILTTTSSTIQNLKTKLLPAAIKSAGKTSDNNRALNSLKTAVDSVQSKVAHAKDIAAPE